MDDAKKMLDSLMGLHRNADRQVMKKKRGNQFKEDTICKHYLAGFCPKHEELFISTKRDIGLCSKVHSDLMREELNAHAESLRYKSEYERKLKAYLEELVRLADEWVIRERRNLAENNRSLQADGPNDTAKVEIKMLQDASAALLAEAEVWAERGSIEESKEKVKQSAELKRKAEDWVETAKAGRADDVCEVCGSRKESQTKNAAGFRHEEGKVHLGYVRIREELKMIREKCREHDEREREEEKKQMQEREARRKERDRSRRRERSRSRRRKDEGAGGDKAEGDAKKGAGGDKAEGDAKKDDARKDGEEFERPRRDDRDREPDRRRDDRDADRRRGRRDDEDDGDARRRRRDDEYDDRDRGRGRGGGRDQDRRASRY